MNTATETPIHQTYPIRHIRSFVRREGRMTEGQQGALARLWDKYGLSIEEKLNVPQEESTILEIGFGMGHSLLELAKANPDKFYIGIEVHRPGVGTLLSNLEEQNVQNVRIYSVDAVHVLKECIPSESLSEVLIYFPDPWPKKRHHKRRLIQSDFVQLVLKALKPGGILHCATDWEDYAHHMMDVLSATSGLINTLGEGQFSSRPEWGQKNWRPETKFEQRGQRLGHHIYDLIFQKYADILQKMR